MRIKFFVFVCVLALFFLGATLQLVTASPAPSQSQQPADIAFRPSPPQSKQAALLLQPGSPIPYIYAESWKEIPFHANNDPDEPERRVPYLVLYRDGTLITDRHERTLVVGVENALVHAPAGIVTATITVMTQHQDPDQGGDLNPDAPFFTVWQETRVLTGTPTPDAIVNVEFRREFTSTVVVMSGTLPITIPTPTDYFWVDLTLNGDSYFGRPSDHAFLMENQWTEPLPEVSEESPGAAPDQLIVYYCDMFPFNTLTQRIARAAVPDYVRTTFADAVIEAFRAQTDDWGMGPWDDKWSGGRDGGDRLSIALNYKGEEWYHGVGQDDASISMHSDAAGWGRHYPNVIDGHMSTFHHELFHNLQINLNQLVEGKGAWTVPFFCEGTAVLATAVGQPVLQFTIVPPRQYMAWANDFLTNDLNRSYSDISVHADIYWRFLYEQCGGMDASGVEHPDAGMQVIKKSHEELYSISPSGNEMGAVALICHSEFVKIILNSLVNFSQIGQESSLLY